MLPRLQREQKNSRVLKMLSIICFALAIGLVVIMTLLSDPRILKKLTEINEFFYEIEMFIAKFDKFMAVAIILFFFIIKSVFPIIPFSVLFIGTGLVFSAPVAVCINAAGFGLLAGIKFLWGRRFGGGGAHKIVSRFDAVSDFMDFEGKGNKWMLVLLRFVPFVPVSAVSRAYGATDMRFTPFVIYSVIGFLPRLISWSVIGVNMTQPFTASFITPVIILLMISGVSLLVLDFLFRFKKETE